MTRIIVYISRAALPSLASDDKLRSQAMIPAGACDIVYMTRIRIARSGPHTSFGWSLWTKFSPYANDTKPWRGRTQHTQ
jgi:hypothetical protein